MQTGLTMLIVACSALYVVWTLLLPATLRRTLALRLSRRRWPKPVRAWLQRRARAPTPCGGCGGCGSPAAPEETARPIRWSPSPNPPRRRS